MPDSAPICVAGKNQIACDVLLGLLAKGYEPSRLRVIPNKDDIGRHTWQPSLAAHAARHNVPIVTLAEAQASEGLTFLSIEFDRILRPDRFAGRNLYNIHFSLLPRHRGVHTAIWPIMQGDRQSGVTLHRIDAGIDTGQVLARRAVEIGDETSSRSLYFSLMDAGARLVLEHVDALVAGTAVGEPQDESSASYHARGDIDFANPPLDLRTTAAACSRTLRAFIFHEYQLPTHEGRQVFAVRPGRAPANSRWRRSLTFPDGIIELTYSPYAELFAWAAGSAELPEGLGWHDVPDLGLRDKRGWSLLDVAAFNANVPALIRLLESGASPRIANLRGTTPLMYARSGAQRTGDTRCVLELLARGADRHAIDWAGKTAAQYAAEDGFAELARLLS